MRAKKSLGQNFLTSQSAVSKIVDMADPSGNDIILEIGPGKGILTEKLLALAGKVVAVEKDDNLFEFLKEKFKKEIETNKLDLIRGDILEFESKKLKAKSYKLVANIPYNITGAILKKFLSSETQPEKMVLMLQKEVAKRIVAKDKKESILSISVKIYGEPKYIQTVKAGSFSPAPKVDSAILLIKNTSKNFFVNGRHSVSTIKEEGKFFEILRAGFKSKRKKLISNLIHLTPPLAPLSLSRRGEWGEVEWKEHVQNAFKKLELDPNLRAEDLDISGWKKLVETLEN